MALGLPTRQLVSQENSARIEQARVPRSRFINTWTRKTNFDPGWLVPIMVDEVLPGDHMQYNVTAYVRMQTPLFPQFDNIRIDTFFFFVPNRILWANWAKFMGEQGSVGEALPATLPVLNDMTLGGEAVNTLYDHFGLPVAGQVAPTYRHIVNALPFRAYNRIFNDWFRDENVMNPADFNTGDGPDSRVSYFTKRRAKAPDYFTTALPWPQKFTAPTVSLGGLAPVIGVGPTTIAPTAGPINVYETGQTIATSYAQYHASANIRLKANPTTGHAEVYANLAAATGISINTLREAWLVQQLLERDARGGTRYVEILKSQFDVTSPDFRLQRSEYIGGGSSMLNITPIAQTNPTGGGGLGALGGAGTASGTHRASFAATEHGWILGLINARVEESYQQGLHRMWTRSTRLDHYWPALAGLGEQAILTKELYATGEVANDPVVFGYQERWQEYRQKYSEVTGIMRSTAAGTLDAWHLARKYTATPVLNNAFMEDNTTAQVQRILAAGAATSLMAFLADIMYQRTATRAIPTYGTPTTLGRF